MSDGAIIRMPAAHLNGGSVGALAQIDAYVVPGDEIRSVFRRDGIYPVVLASGSVYPAALQLFVEWLDLTGAQFDPGSEPWLPVGRVGPIPVLGHYDVRAPAFLREGWFQPVLLQRAEYERHLDLCGPLIAAAAKPDWNGEESAAPRRAYPGSEASLVHPSTPRAALRFLLEYFPHQRADLAQVQRLLAECDDLEADELPAGYWGACWRIMNRGAVADPTVLVPPDAVVRRLPSELLLRAHPISEYGRNLWIGATRLPQPQIEDLVLNELGEGWHVHFVLMDGCRFIDRSAGREPYADARSGEGDNGRVGGRRRVKIEDARTRSRPGDRVREPGIIRLSQKDVRELEAYDARRPDRDALRVFLKELSAGVRLGATDLHIEAGLESYRVRARIDGCLEEWLEMPADFGRKVVGAAKEQFGMAPERWLPQDGACTVHHGAEVVNLRISAYPIRGDGQKLAIRFLPRRGDVPPLDELMPPREAALMRRAISRPFGLILLCGPTGSGKTTTTFSALAEVNTADVNITTMEDPVEYEMDGVNQAELDKARAVTWDVLLAGFLRQDPDIGMLGEIRDRETAETAIRLTLTGHIVFATLHTMSCAHTVQRLVDTGVNAQMFANAATLLVSQRLLRRLCRTCRETGRRALTDAERKLFARHAVTAPDSVCEPTRSPCENCRSTGYKGQVAAFEMLPVTEEVAQMIAEKRSVRALEEWMRQNGFPRVFQSALMLAAAGETSLTEANQWQAVWDGFDGLANGGSAATS